MPSLARWSRLQRALLGLGQTRPKVARAPRKPTPTPSSPKPLGERAPARKSAPSRLGKPRRKTAEQMALGAGESESLAMYAKPQGANVHVRLSYTLYWPQHGDTPAKATSDGACPLPVMMMLHGCQQTVLDLATGTRMNRLADTHGFVVVYPQQARTRQSHRCWRWFQPDDSGGALEADALAILLQEILTRHAALDRSRVYVAGLSAGAGMAALLALRHPALIAALAMHSGPVVGDAQNVRGGLRTMQQGSETDPIELVRGYVGQADALDLPTLILHGTRDAVVAARNAEQLVRQFLFINGLNPALPPSTTLLAHGSAQAYRRHDYMQGRQTQVRWCELDRVEHAWSGGDERVKFHTRNGPDASLLIWRFVSAHRRVIPTPPAAVTP